MTDRKTLSSVEEYGVGWIAPLSIERTAAIAMLDERHNAPSDFYQHETDKNSYSWGCLAGHNIVIASLGSLYGDVETAWTTSEMLASLPRLKFGLLVGIGAGIPTYQDIRLGDVAVSWPDKTSPGVVKYDLDKSKTGEREPKGVLAPPPVLQRAVTHLQAEHNLEESRIPEFLKDAAQRYPKWAPAVLCPDPDTDRLFESSYSHQHSGEDCSHCQTTKQIPRPKRLAPIPEIHYGTIGTGSMLVKDAGVRDDIVKRIGTTCICLEMEAAALMNDFPCIVIRGICDYADSHKNDLWQPFAAASAAAYAKELLTYTRVIDVERTRAACDMLENLQTDISEIKTSLEANLLEAKISEHKKRVFELLQALYTCPYIERKNRNIERLEGTCKWFTEHYLFNHWQSTEGSSLLWVSADPGCGKSVLARYLIDVVLPDSEHGSERGDDPQTRTICYFFFKDEFTDQKTSANALCSILRQLFQQNPDLVHTEILDQFASEGSKYIDSFQSLWDTFLSASADPAAGEIICVLDALDECQIQDCRQLVEAICNLYDKDAPQRRLKFLVTSRPYGHILDIFRDLKDQIPTIHLQGENEDEIQLIAREIDLVIDYRVQRLGRHRQLTMDETNLLSQKFASIPHRTYLWAHLTLSFLEQALILNKDSINRILEDLPASVDQAYNKILSRSTDKEKSKMILQAIIAAVRPLTLDEMPVVLAITKEHVGSKELINSLEPVERCSTTIRNLCGLFVVFIDRRIYLLHQTAREFLLKTETNSEAVPTSNELDHPLVWKGCVEISKANRMLAERCLWFLNQSQHADFLEYSTTYWAQHFRESDITDEDESTGLASQLCIYWSTDGYDNWRSFDKPPRQVPPRKVLGPSPIMLPAFLGLAPIVKKLLASKLEQKCTTRDKSQAVWLASSQGFTEVVRLLLSAGGRVNTNKTGRVIQLENTPATSKSFVYSVPNTSMSGPAAKDLKTSSPLHLAAYVGNVGLTGLLIDNGADVHISNQVGNTPLQVAAAQYHKDVINLLLKHGAERETRNSSGFTPLQSFYHTHRGQCSASRAADVFTLLHDIKSSIDQQFDYKRTMLHTVALHGCTHCVKVLLMSGAGVELRNEAEETLLHYAQVMDSFDMVQLVVSYRMPMDLVCSNGWTPLIRAIRRNSLIATSNLLEFGSNPNTPDRNGLTPLMHAGIMGYEVSSVSIVDILLAKHARIDDVDYLGNSCLHHALQGKNIKNIEALLAVGADVNWQNAEGMSPLMLLCSQIGWKSDYRRAIALLLLQHGAKIEIEDKNGCTALSHCKKLVGAWRLKSKRSSDLRNDWDGFHDIIKMLEGWDATE